MSGATKLIKFLVSAIKSRWPFSIHKFFGSYKIYDGKKVKNIWLALERLNFDWLHFEKL
jgi:hypothetical protein